MKKKIAVVILVALVLFFNVDKKEGRLSNTEVTAVRIFNCLIIAKDGNFQKVESVRDFDFSEKEESLVYISCDGEKCRLYH